jgi:hypothetical protein
MLVKILTAVITVAILIVVFVPMIPSQLDRATSAAFHCVKCNRGFHSAETFTWHQQAMHPELAIAEIDAECTVGEARAYAAIDIAPAPPSTPAVADAGVVEVRSGGRVYRVITGGRK